MGSKISVFGGSLVQPGGSSYQDAYRLGELLAQSGHTVLTGGYIGTMEALSRGAAEAGGHVIGVTCDEIEAWRSVKANHWVIEEWHYASFQERIFALIHRSDALLALPGGVGTLVEILLSWNLLITRILPPRPLILIGEGWKATIQQFLHEQDAYIPENQRQWLTFTPDVDTAFQRLQAILIDAKS